MPEFQLDHGGSEATKVFNSLATFTQGYVEAMFFTEHDSELKDATFANLAPETLTEIIESCDAFQTGCAALLQQAYNSGTYDDHQAGIDFWLTRNRHGFGFWDRGLGRVGDELTEMAHPYGERNPYVANDGLIYL